MSCPKNPSFVLRGIHDTILEDRPIPEPKEHEVQVEVHTVGICGSDVHYLTHGRISDYIVTSPMVLGHESSGVISKVGSKVDKLKVGDRVALEPGKTCGSCKFCKDGRYNLCPDCQFHATPPYDGSLAKFITHPAALCFPLPDNISLSVGALAEPLSVGVHACNRAKITTGDSVFIAGAGPIGIMNLIAAKEMGATKIVVMDIRSERLQMAARFGASATVLIEPAEALPQVTARLREAFGTEPPRVSLECSGQDSAMAAALEVTENGGCVVMVGMGAPTANVPLIKVPIKELDIKGVFRYAHCYPKALEILSRCHELFSRKMQWHDQPKADNALPIKVFSLEECRAGFDCAEKSLSEIFKVMIQCKSPDGKAKNEF